RRARLVEAAVARPGLGLRLRRERRGGPRQLVTTQARGARSAARAHGARRRVPAPRLGGIGGVTESTGAGERRSGWPGWVAVAAVAWAATFILWVLFPFGSERTRTIISDVGFLPIGAAAA